MSLPAPDPRALTALATSYRLGLSEDAYEQAVGGFPNPPSPAPR